MGMWDWIRDVMGTVAPPTESSPASLRRATPEARPSPAPSPSPEDSPPSSDAPASRKRRKKDGKPAKAKRRARRERDPAAPRKPKKPNKAKKRRPPGWSGADPSPAAAAAPAPAEAPPPRSSLLPRPPAPPEPPPPVGLAQRSEDTERPDTPTPRTRRREAPTGAPRSDRRSPGQETLAWIVVGKLEALLEQVDGTLADADAPRDQLVNAKKRFLREWRALRPVPRSEEARLGPAYDERLAALDARIAALPDPKAEEEVRNVHAREMLIAEAAGLAAQPDLKAAIGRAKELQKRWRDSPRVSREAARGLSDRFKAAVDAVFARREADRTERLQALQPLVTSAEALTRAPDPVLAAEAMKRLQAQWKEIGGVPGPAGDAVWTSFRAAADQVFEARRAHYETEQAANVAAREALIAEAVRLAGDGVEDPDEVVRGLHRRWKKIGRVPRDQADALWASFREACDTLRNPPALLPEELGDGQDTLRFNPFAGIGDDR